MTFRLTAWKHEREPHAYITDVFRARDVKSTSAFVQQSDFSSA